MSLSKRTTRKSYSFKSSGTNTKDLSNEPTPEVKKPPIGIKTPLEISFGQGLFVMHDDLGKTVADNLRNLIMTNHGERLGFPDFGANLKPILFDLGRDEGDLLAIQLIKTAVGKYMPFVNLQGFQSFIDAYDENTIAKIGIQITYTIPAADDLVRSLELLLYVGG